MASKAEWFDVDKDGLAKLLERRGKEFIAYELLANAWDSRAGRVRVTVSEVRRGLARIAVDDDCPDGFANLQHAYTLFAESGKKGDAGKRGRFNLGEKLVLALCAEATISTTTGTVVFDAAGRHALKRRQEVGSVFTGTVRMTRSEVEQVITAVRTVLPPAGVETLLDDEEIPRREPIRVVEVTLPTDLADKEGRLRRSERRTTVEVVGVRLGETATLYELGIPVVETGDRFHYNVLQKVPLNMDRDNVTPAYLRAVRTAVLSACSDLLAEPDATATWVRDAAGHPAVSDEAVKRVLDLRFGERRVSPDVKDREAERRAVAAGYAVVQGGSLSAGEWENARRAGAILPAGKVTPSPKPFAENGRPLKKLDSEEWSSEVRRVATYAAQLGERLLGKRVTVEIADDPGWGFAAAYDRSETTGHLIINRAGTEGAAVFGGDAEALDRLLLHEFAHEYEADHLSVNFAEAGFRLGAKLKRIALEDPEFFGASRVRTGEQVTVDCAVVRVVHDALKFAERRARLEHDRLRLDSCDPDAKAAAPWVLQHMKVSAALRALRKA